MTHQTLSQAINRFTQIIQNVPDAELQRPWGWQSYDSEGIRFAFSERTKNYATWPCSCIKNVFVKENH